jgi:hypothetical protein
MFTDSDLKNYIEINNTIKTESLVIAEWNLNDFENIENYGNYRYRPGTQTIYNTLPLSYDKQDLGDYYTDAITSTITSETLLDNQDSPISFSTVDVNRGLYYDLRQCFNSFRPRSGINKPLFFDTGKYVDEIKSGERPRYYLASKNDVFKYWNSFRLEDSIERGVSKRTDPNSIGYEITDVSPFIVYKEDVACNRIVVKMQTNLAKVSLLNLKNQDGQVIVDPLGDKNKSTIPKRWSIEYLDNNDNWLNAITFNEDSLRRDGTDIVKWDGYVELFYGISIPDKYKGQFYFVDMLDDSTQLPPYGTVTGESYIINASSITAGDLKVWDEGDYEWKTFAVEYKFQLLEDDNTKKVGTIQSLTNPSFYIDGGRAIFRDIVFLKGLRLKVETMYAPDVTFDLIELSPRLAADISNYVLGFEITKSLSNDTTGLPVGNVSVSNGSMTIMNHDFAFSDQNLMEDNQGSIISNLLNPNTRVDFYEIVKSVNDYDKYIPIKSMYVESFPKGGSGLIDVNLTLRDSFFKFETQSCPALFFQNVSLTFAVAALLDNIGFGNYVFKNISGKTDPIIPYFFVEPEANVAEVLQRLSLSTQTAMFFDEYNNFVVMSKEYLLPNLGERQTDMVMLGQKTNEVLPNVIEIKDGQTKVINDGKINYTTRYVQRVPISLKQGIYTDEDRTYGYQPVLLWEVPAQTNYKTINEKSKTGTYTLGAVALNLTIPAVEPYVENNQILNNVIDIGENVYWLPRLQGYLYANGEIIKYDAIQYTIPGVGIEWITDEIEYQEYFSQLPFNGKMYPTGLIRIYTEPYYEDIINASATYTTVYKNGPIKKSGRAQFGTKLVEHPAGLRSFWSDVNNLDGYKMDSSYLFTTTPTEKITRPPEGSASEKVWQEGKLIAKNSLVNGVIANFQRENIPSDDTVKTLKVTSKGTVQSSALVFNGPSSNATKDNISLVKKTLDSDYKHFGTRIRIIGRKESNQSTQTATNASEYYIVPSPFGSENVTLSGGSGGMAIMLDSDNINGYYFEICTLSTDNLENYNTKDKDTGEESSVLHNILFYKVTRGILDSKEIAIPVKLWGGLSKILTDEGKFVGQDRISNESNPTIYDLAIEYKDIGATRRFYLYLNGTQIATVDDGSPLPKYNNMALFIRSRSKCMFENIYALKNQESQNKTTIVEDVSKIFGAKQITSSDTLKKYSLSGFIQDAYLSGIETQTAPKYDIYYDEFGTILRECAYFNIKYDKAYPAFRAMLKPIFSNEKTYVTSGFYADSYGAEFLVFNATDKMITLDETSGNYLQIIGITFTQNTSNTLTADSYYQERSSFSDPVIINNAILSPSRQEKIFQDVKISRSKYGKQEFTLDTLYIQSEDQAKNLLGWVLSKTISPRRIVLLEVFATSHLQLGDIVTIDYTMPSGDKFVDVDKQFVVSEIQYARSTEGPSSIIKVVEVNG